MRLLVLAVRNLLRNTRRTLLTAAAISFGLAMTIFTACLQEGSYDAMIRTAVRQLAGHVVVQAPGYQEEKDETLVVTGSSEIAERLRSAFPDATIARRIALSGLLVSPRSAVGAAVMAVEPSAEAGLVALDDDLVEGAWLTDDDDRGIVIGRAMADQLGVGVGDKVVYMGQHGGEEMASRLFRVRGIFRTGGAEMDGFVAYGHLAAGQELLDRGDVANLVTVHLPRADAADAARAEAARLLEGRGLDIRTWVGALPELYAVIQVDRSSGNVMLAMIGLIVAMGVLNTVLMSTLERTREFGVLLAIGMRRRSMAALVLLEGLVLGLGGALLGLILGAAIVVPLTRYGIDYSGFVGGEQMEMSGVGIDAVVHPVWAWGRVVAFTGLAVLFTLFSAAWPAWRVTRLTPVEAMRHV